MGLDKCADGQKKMKTGSTQLIAPRKGIQDTLGF